MESSAGWWTARAFVCVIMMVGLLAGCVGKDSSLETRAPIGETSGSPIRVEGLYQPDPPATARGKESGADESAPLPVVLDDPSLPLEDPLELVPNVWIHYAGLSPEQQLVVDEAVYLEIRHCMKEQGFDLVDPPPSLSPPTPVLPVFDGYIGILDANYARRFGYQYNSDATQEAGGNTPSAFTEYPSGEYELALGGGAEPHGGCRGGGAQTHR